MKLIFPTGVDKCYVDETHLSSLVKIKLNILGRKFPQQEMLKKVTHMALDQQFSSPAYSKLKAC